MKKTIHAFFDAFFGRELDFRARLFNVLAVAGAVISLLVAALGPFTGAAPVNSLACLFSFLLAVIFLYYSNRTGRYRLFYFITIVVVFILFFPVMFFTAGGYHSGMPVFFVFAVVFTVFMLDDKAAFCMAALELLVYSGLCLYAFRRPESVHFFETEEKLLIDVITAFVVASVVLGITIFLHFRIYNEQHRQLEKARKEAIRLSEIKSTFLANMSHEIRTPINVILGMNEMILRESALLSTGGEQIADYSSSIRTAGKTLLELINNILDLSKIESGKTEVLDEEYKTADLIQELSLAGSERAGGKGLRFILETDERLPRKLYGDFIHLKQIGLNFLSNAAKYTEQGSITLRISGNREEIREDGTGASSPAVLLRIAVEDTGIGIKEEHREMLFDAFTRVDLPVHRNIEGTGLGLAIARELTELMGGKITVESEWGKGSVFALEVPQIIQHDEPMGSVYSGGAAKVKREGPSFTASGGRVLAVDDNRENLLVLRSLLRRTLLTVDTATSGSECLDAVKQKNYHVIFMDYMMSGMDGIETFRRLREENKNFTVPVVALTADARREMKQRFLEEGFSGCLTKPVMWRDLEQCLRERLPAELVTGGEITKPEFPPEGKAERHDGLAEKTRDSLAKDLSAWGVLLDEGQRYLEPETGLSQYKRLAEFFAENYEAARKEALVMADQKDWKNLRFSVHSLKSKARAMGASDLYATAACMEKHCIAGDGTYIETAMPLFLLEWERACRGLEEFTARMNALTGEAGEKPEAPGISRDADMETLLRHIRGNRWNEATKTLNRLLVTAADETEKRKLAAIQEKIGGLDFEGAEKLLLTNLH
ncbi:MAG: response regulator [Treponema sp.]|jgi:signal transduction histidine kinase/DNA-binding response OmpR family regulator/HPt (histidine-containing phosphotransfer) domain-containing protein|nr:response regulator [Treponema sp.]